MKKNVPFLFLRIGGFLALLGVAAFALMMLIKLIISAVIVVTAGAVIFKLISNKRRHLLHNNYAMLGNVQQQKFSRSKIHPIFNNNRNPHKTIIPVL